MSESVISFTLLANDGASSALTVFLLYTLVVFGLAAVSNRLMRNKSFLSEYFLGSRSLGVWAFALTFAATSASGGSFTGFPSRIYSHGWILALWISSYMVFPLCTMGILGKRINQVARISGAITVPDVFRDRFRSPAIGVLSVTLIVFFMSFNLVAQFKAGSKILIVLLRDNALFQDGIVGMQTLLPAGSAIAPDYLLCLLMFALAVILYTTYGGFHAVVWTDVMQGIVMVFGVMIMLPLAISQVGGTEALSSELSGMTTPRIGFVEVTVEGTYEESKILPGRWVSVDGDDGRPRLLRLNSDILAPVGEAASSQEVKYVELTTPSEIERQLRRLKTEEGSGLLTDIPGVDVSVRFLIEREYLYGANRAGAYVTGPGPLAVELKDTAAAEAERNFEQEQAENLGFLAFSIAISYFFMWAISGTGQPSNMVRLMAFNSSITLRRSIFTVMIYFSLIYFPLVIIFCSARVLIPGMELDADSIMPSMAVELTSTAGHPWLAGLLVAAPFAAIMSTVDSFLLMISSAVVRDIYQRNINPDASEKRLKRLSFLCTLLVGFGAMIGAINPPKFLQDIIVYVGSGLSACFLAPAVYMLYWPRLNKQGMIGGMLSGFAAHLLMYVAGMSVNGSFFKPWQPMGFDPIIVGLFVSFLMTYLITKAAPPPDEDLVRRYFKKKLVS
jgi:sodium/pantothenate symporter